MSEQPERQPVDPAQEARRRRDLLFAFGIAVAATVAFLPAISGGWIYDDHPLIAQNPYIRSFQWWPRWFLTDFWDVNEEAVRFGTRIVYWRPAITASYALDWQLGGGSPVVFHVTNTIAHAAVAVLSFVMLRRWIGASVPAALAALVFALHPTKAESVAWIAGRTDVFCMIAIILVAEGVARRLANRRGGLVLEILGTLLAYMTKEQAIVIPAFVAVEVWVAAGRPSIDVRVIRRIIIGVLPQTLVAIAYLGARSKLLPISAVGVDSSIAFTDHVQAVLETFGRFVSLTVWPAELSIQQGLVRHAQGEIVHSMPYMVTGAVVVAALLAIATVARRRWPYVTVGIALYFVTLLPTANIRYTDMVTLVSERFLYLPMIGVAFAVGCALARLQARRRALIAVVAVLVAALGARSAVRSADYRNEQVFWDRELAMHPESPLAQQFAINEALRERRNKEALVLALELSESPVGYRDLNSALQVAEILALIIPDKDVAGLRAIDQFARDVIEKKVPAASLTVRGLQFNIPTQSKAFANTLAKLRMRFVAVRVDVHSRLGDDAGAIALATPELSLCATCAPAIVMNALARARAGDYETAELILAHARGRVPQQLLDAIEPLIAAGRAAHERKVAAAPGAPQLQARASELAALELWGRAYDVLAPHKAEIMRAPKFVVGFAELAFRAGDGQVARDALAVSHTPSQVESLLATWTEKMGWTE